jgi:hypothetical protein
MEAAQQEFAARLQRRAVSVFLLRLHQEMNLKIQGF